MSDLEFTGERLVPGKVDKDLYHEHLARYLFAAQYVKDKKALDFGCGTGYGTDVLKKHGASGVVGMDISAEAIAYAASHYQGDGVEFISGDCTASSFAAGSFDVVVSFEVLEHIEDFRAFLAEAKRVLRKGGLFLVSTPNKKIYAEDQEGKQNPFHLREFYLDEFRSLIKEYFPFADVYGQFRTQGMLIKRPSTDDKKMQALKGDLAMAEDNGGDADQLENSIYFVAVCSEDPAAMDQLNEYFFLAAPGDAISKLTGWARRLDQELGQAKARNAALWKEFQERTAWALKSDEEVKQLRDLHKQKDEEFRRKCEELAELDKEFRAKCVEVASKHQELPRVCDQSSEAQQRFDAELKKKDEEIDRRDMVIAVYANSISWKITAPFRAIFGMFKKRT